MIISINCSWGSLGAEMINRIIEDNIEFIKSKNVFLYGNVVIFTLRIINNLI